MKNIDMRFDQNILQNWIGKKLLMFKCDPFVFTNSVTQFAGLFMEDSSFLISNIQETVDYYGAREDIAILKLVKTKNDEVKSAFTDTEMIVTPINDIITEIKLVNENQKVNISGEQYNVWLTRGIIISAGGREISFEKDMVPFSEEIIIRRGYDLIQQFADEKQFLDGWNNENHPECNRQIITL